MMARRPIPDDGAAVRVLILNVHTENDGFDQVRRLIEEVRPAVIGLVEVDRRWLAAIAPAVAGYPGRLEQPRGDNFGIALYARGPLAGSIEALGGSLPSVVASVTVDGTRLDIVLIHPLPPIDAAAVAAQRDELDAVAERTRRMTGPVLIMGDFNATPWSRPFRRVLARSGLCDSRAGFGIEASFPRRPRSCGSRSIMCWRRARSECAIGASSATSDRITCRHHRSGRA
jgi:endonuclease/exonuclease/phosphatase (EEP) superfamily protein YafD